MKYLIILRGIPGAGKSTCANVLSENAYPIFSADDFFIVDGEYVFNADKLHQAHAQCKHNTEQAMIDNIEKIFVANQTTADQFSLAEFKNQIEHEYQKMANLIGSIDKTLMQTVEGEKQKAMNGVDMLEAKVLKAFKRKYDDDLNLIRSSKEKLFPNLTLQERQDSFWMFYLKYGSNLMPELIEHFNAFDQKMTIVS